MNILIPMAGKGSRFSEAGFSVPKPLIEVDGKTLIEHSVASLGIDGKYIFITRQYDNPLYNEELTKVLQKIAPNNIEIKLNSDQEGAADAALYAKEYINNDEELIVTNCDQLMNWRSEIFSWAMKGSQGGLVTFTSSDPRHSYAKVFEGRVVDIAEKNVISNEALVGIHYYRYGSDFVLAAEKLKIEYKERGFKECYVSLTYLYLLDKHICTYRIDPDQYIPLGIPKDIEDAGYEIITHRDN